MTAPSMATGNVEVRNHVAAVEWGVRVVYKYGSGVKYLSHAAAVCLSHD
jgi:hypothetical protein